MTQTMNRGRILVLETGSLTTRIGYLQDSRKVFIRTLNHSAYKIASFPKIMDQEAFRREEVLSVLGEEGIALTDIDIIMARGGLFAPVRTGVYRVNRDMRDVLLTCRDGVHACNLGPVIADDIADMINEMRDSLKGEPSPFGTCRAYIADAPMSDEMAPECRLGGIPEFPRRAFFHALNSRAAVRMYLEEEERSEEGLRAIVAHLGGGITVTVHRSGEVIDTNNGLGGDGPFTPERAGTCPAFPLVEMCFSGKYTETEIKKKLVGEGGAVAYFGTSDMAEIIRRADEGGKEESLFLDAFCLSVSKHICAGAATLKGKVDVIILTGTLASLGEITSRIKERVGFVAPVREYPGEHYFESLARYGYSILAGEVPIHRYDKNAIVAD